MSKLLLIFSSVWFLAAPLAGADTLRDPTRPLDYQVRTTSVTPPALNAILISEGRKRAVINGKTLREGESAGSVTVLRIQPGKVLVRFQGRQRELQLNASLRQ